MLFQTLTLALLPTLGGNDGAPRVEVHFPPSGALTDATTLHVTGSATDLDGVAAIRVNGIGATSSDGFAHWSVEVPIALGHQQLVVESVDLGGAIDPHAAVVTLANTGPFLLDGSCVAADAASGAAYVFERDRGSLLEVDVTTGLRREISGPQHGAGPSLASITAIASFASGSSLAVTTIDQLLRVDLATGDRTVLSAQGVGSGMMFGAPRAVAYSAAHDRFYVVDGLGKMVLAIEPATGNRSIHSTAGVGGGTPIYSIVELVDDAAGNRSLAFDDHRRRLLAIDHVTGFRTTLSDDLTGTGPSLGKCAGLTVDALGTTAFVLLATDGSVIAVDLATGNRTAVGGASDWWTWVLSPVHDGLAFDAHSGNVLLLYHDVFEALDPTTGITTPVTSNSRGTGPRDDRGWNLQPRVPVLLPGEKELLLTLTDSDRDRFVRVDLESGDRLPVPIDATQVALQYKGGPAFDARHGLAVMLRLLPSNMATLTRIDLATGVATDIPNLVTTTFPGKGLTLDPARKRVYAGFPSGVRAVELDTGSWSIITGSGVGAGPIIKYVNHALYDAAWDRLFVSDGTGRQVLSADPATGDRTVLASDTVGSGLQFATPQAMALDTPRGRLLVSDVEWNALLSVDLSTLERRVITKSASNKKVDGLGHAPKDRGDGPVFASPQGLALDARRNVAYTIHEVPLEGVLCVELGSGDRVLISR